MFDSALRRRDSPEIRGRSREETPTKRGERGALLRLFPRNEGSSTTPRANLSALSEHNVIS